jgi:glycerol uptake facilitator-like aquaporin
MGEVLPAPRKDASAPVAGGLVGLALALVNIMGIPIDGASVNPARSFGLRSSSAARP